MKPYKRINEDYLDKTDIELDSVSPLDDAGREVFEWIMGRGPRPDFNPEVLPDGFYNVGNKLRILDKTVKFLIKELGTSCNLNWLDVSNIRNMGGLFAGSEFNGDISRWDVSNVREMSRMFSESYFNRDISKWNVGNVLNMYGMFEHSLFNKDISSWNVSSVQNMDYMFARSSFSKNISGWDVSSVNTHYQTFYMSILPDEFRPKFRVNEDYLDKQDVQLDSVSVLEDAREDIERWIENDVPLPFNPQILPDGFFCVEGRKQLGTIIDKAIRDFGHECSLNWLDVSEVEMMNWLFSGKDFNGEISRWDTSGVTDMQAMFYESTFNNNISQWDVSNVDNMFGIFNKCPFCQDISMWNCAAMKPDALERAFSTSKLPDEYKPKPVSFYRPKFGDRKKKVNEDFLDNRDLELDDVDVMDDVCKELDTWLSREGWIDAYKNPPSFDPLVLPDGFYRVTDSGLKLRNLMFKISSTLGNDCSMNWLDVSGVTSMRGLFASMQFNGDISRWDVSNVEDMTSMFEDSKFNGNISGWDVSSVRYMSKIFDRCPFCQDISMLNFASMKPELLKDALKWSKIPKKFKPKAPKQP